MDCGALLASRTPHGTVRACPPWRAIRFPHRVVLRRGFLVAQALSLCAFACVAAGRPFPPTRQPSPSRPVVAGLFGVRRHPAALLFRHSILKIRAIPDQLLDFTLPPLLSLRRHSEERSDEESAFSSYGVRWSAPRTEGASQVAGKVSLGDQPSPPNYTRTRRLPAVAGRFAFPQTAPRNAVTSHRRGPFVFPIALFFVGVFRWHRLSACALLLVSRRVGRCGPGSRRFVGRGFSRDTRMSVLFFLSRAQNGAPRSPAKRAPRSPVRGAWEISEPGGSERDGSAVTSQRATLRFFHSKTSRLQIREHLPYPSHSLARRSPGGGGPLAPSHSYFLPAYYSLSSNWTKVRFRDRFSTCSLFRPQIR